jgi:hypothetical protein
MPKPSRRGSASGAQGKAKSWESLSASLDKKWEGAVEGAGGPPEIADGVYSARLTGATCGVIAARDSRSADVPWVSMNWVILDGPDAGKRPRSFFRLVNAHDPENNIGMEQFVRQLTYLGYEVNDLKFSEIPSLCKDLSDPKEGQPTANIRVRNREGDDGAVYQDVFVTRSGAAGADAEPEPSPVKQPPKRSRRK